MEYKNFMDELEAETVRETTKIENAYDSAVDARRKADQAETDLLTLEISTGQLEFKDMEPDTELSKAAQTLVRLQKAVARARVQIAESEKIIVEEMHKQNHFAFQVPVDDMKFRFMLKSGAPKVKVEYADK